MQHYGKKYIKIEFVGESEWTDTEKELFQAALFELHDKFYALGIAFDQPVYNDGAVVIETLYPYDIKQKMKEHSKNVIEEKSLSEADLDAIRSIIKEEIHSLDMKNKDNKYGISRFRF